jgi:predicted Ser/Thr protein kinase
LLTRTDLAKLPAKHLRQGHTYKADLSIIRVAGEDLVLKDYHHKKGAWRDLLGVTTTSLEARALRVLEGISGVPQFRGRPDRFSVLMTYVPARRARRVDPRVKGNPDFVSDLERIVREMHARGVVHLDLKHRSNVLVGEDGRAVVIDFESALTFNPDRWYGRFALHLLRKLDELALLNWKRRLCPEMLTERQARQAQRLRTLGKWWLPRRLVDGILSIWARR